MSLLKEGDACPICSMFKMRKINENFISCNNDNCQGKAKKVNGSDFYELVDENYLINES